MTAMLTVEGSFILYKRKAAPPVYSRYSGLQLSIYLPLHNQPRNIKDRSHYNAGGKKAIRKGNQER